MHSKKIRDWIIKNLKGEHYNLIRDEATGIRATWESTDRYQIEITYLINNKRHSRIVATEVALEDSINFRLAEKHKEKDDPYDEEKLSILVEKIEQCLKKSGDFKLELVGNTDFKITPFEK